MGGNQTEKKALNSKDNRRRAGKRYFLTQVFPPTDDHGYSEKSAEVGDGLTISREAGMDNRLVVLDQGISREHCRLTPERRGLLLSDLGSTNGTFVNGSQIGDCMVSNQDVIRVCDALFVVTEALPGRSASLRHAGIVAASRQMLDIGERLERVARTSSRVLLLGETGTGKDLFASHLHTASGRHGEMVTVNCATIQDGLIESTLFGSREGAFTGARDRPGLLQQAHRGTLFLDEIGELPQTMQAAILRVLESGEVTPVGSVSSERVNVRFVAATNRLSPDGTVGTTLRADLLARLEDETVVLPPLRERREDIVPLIFSVVRLSGRPPSAVLAPDFVERALYYPWPRNIRQLLKAVEGCLTHLAPGKKLTPEGFDQRLSELARPRRLSKGPGKVAPPSADLLEALLKQEGGKIARVARRLGCHRQQVYRWLKRDETEPD